MISGKQEAVRICKDTRFCSTEAGACLWEAAAQPPLRTAPCFLLPNLLAVTVMMKWKRELTGNKFQEMYFSDFHPTP